MQRKNTPIMRVLAFRKRLIVVNMKRRSKITPLLLLTIYVGVAYRLPNGKEETLT